MRGTTLFDNGFVHYTTLTALTVGNRYFCLCSKYEGCHLNESYFMAILKGNVKNSDVQLGILPPKMA